MNFPTKVLIVLLAFMAGCEITDYIHTQEKKRLYENVQLYQEIHRQRAMEVSVEQANGLLRSHRQDIASGKAKFRACMWGVGLDIF